MPGNVLVKNIFTCEGWKFYSGYWRSQPILNKKEFRRPRRFRKIQLRGTQIVIYQISLKYHLFSLKVPIN